MSTPASHLQRWPTPPCAGAERAVRPLYPLPTRPPDAEGGRGRGREGERLHLGGEVVEPGADRDRHDDPLVFGRPAEPKPGDGRDGELVGFPEGSGRNAAGLPDLTFPPCPFRTTCSCYGTRPPSGSTLSTGRSFCSRSRLRALLRSSGPDLPELKSRRHRTATASLPLQRHLSSGATYFRMLSMACAL